MKLTPFLLTVVIIGLSSCQKLIVEEPPKKVSYYYNLDSLLNSQRDHLLQTGAELKKWAVADGDTSTSIYQPDTATLKGELGVFRKVDINKPVLEGIYNESIVGDTHSNLKIKQYLPNEGSDVEVDYLKIYYLDNIQNIKRIEARYKENNPIYKSNRMLTLQFEQRKGGQVLTSFQISGTQKIILKDSVNFEVNTEVIYN